MRTNSRCVFGCMTLHRTSTSYEPSASNVPNANMDTIGARFVPMVDLTRDDDNANSHKSDMPLQLPASAHFPFEQLSIGHALTSKKRPSATCCQTSTHTKSNRIESLAITESSKCTSCRTWTSRRSSTGHKTSSRSPA